MRGTMDRDGRYVYEHQQIYAKSIEAVNNLEKVAYQFGHQEIEEEHLLSPASSGRQPDPQS